jgi:hypothetical protein
MAEMTPNKRFSPISKEAVDKFSNILEKDPVGKVELAFAFIRILGIAMVMFIRWRWYEEQLEEARQLNQQSRQTGNEVNIQDEEDL